MKKVLNEYLCCYRFVEDKEVKEVKGDKDDCISPYNTIGFEKQVVLSLTSQRPTGRDNSLYFFIFFTFASLRYLITCL